MDINPLNLLVVMTISFFAVTVFARRIGTGQSRAIVLWAWHTLFCILYAFLVSSSGGDATFYFTQALNGAREFKFGTNIVINITRLLNTTIGFDFLSTSIIFGTFGAIGLIALDKAIFETVRFKSSLVQTFGNLIIFLPSLNFWSAGLGKDSLVFMGTGLFLWAVQKLNTRVLIILLAVLIVMLIRPHVAIFYMGALIIGIFLSSKFHKSLKTLFLISTAIALYFLFPLVSNYVGLGQGVTTTNIELLLEKRQQSNWAGGSSIDIASMNPVQRMFTYSFRPFIFESRSAFELLSAIDNLVILGVFLLVVFKGVGILSTGLTYTVNNRMVLIFIILSVWVILSQITANLGIAQRQKWMFIPALFILFFDSRLDQMRVRE